MGKLNNITDYIERYQNDIQTPCYLYSPYSAKINYHSLKEALGTNLIVSIKANSNFDFLSLLGNRVDGYEATSLNELKTIVQLNAQERFMNSPALGELEIKKCLASNTVFIIDNLEQLDEILGTPYRDKIEIFLRVNSSEILKSKEVKINQDQFGLSINDAKLACNRLNHSHVVVKGIHTYSGSYTFSQIAFALIDGISDLVCGLESILNYKLTAINLGGGFSSNWQYEEFDFSKYRDALNSRLSGYVLYHESGRAVFERAGWFVTKVIKQKEIGNCLYSICDGGIAHSFLLCQTEAMIKRYRSPHFIKETQLTEPVDLMFVGNSCNRQDIIGKAKSSCRAPVTGSLLVFDDCGAYHQSYSPVNFLGLEKAKTYILMDEIS